MFGVRALAAPVKLSCAHWCPPLPRLVTRTQWVRLPKFDTPSILQSSLRRETLSLLAAGDRAFADVRQLFK